MKSEMHSLRLASHLLGNPSYNSVKEVVKHYGCMQAQDIPQATRVIGSRVPWSCKEDIKTACRNWDIVRTWPMRGTLHYMAPEYVSRMLDLCASKTLWGFAKRREFLGIWEKDAERALEIMESALRWWKQLTRTQLWEALLEWGISMQPQRVYHLSCYAATRKLICFWAPTDKEETFVLLDERIKPEYKSKKYTYEEQLAELAHMYIRSHGPATADDLAWRSGLGKTVCKQAISLIEDQLEVIEHNGKKLYYVWMPDQKRLATQDKNLPKTYLLGGFDEYFIGYKDRSPLVDAEHHTKLFTKNGIFFPLIVMEWKIVGSRKRTWKKQTLTITASLLPGMQLPREEILKEAQRYAEFRTKERETVTIELILVQS